MVVRASAVEVVPVRRMVRDFGAAVVLSSMAIDPSFLLPQSSATNSSLSQKMSPKDQVETGVIGLSTIQKKALNKWIDRYVAQLGLVQGQASAASEDIYTKCYNAAMEPLVNGKEVALPQVCRVMVDKYEHDLKASGAGSAPQRLEYTRLMWEHLLPFVRRRSIALSMGILRAGVGKPSLSSLMGSTGSRRNTPIPTPTLLCRRLPSIRRHLAAA